ncbi:hypothetical protein L6164_003696 [Bauhinia variegata]|uniref:Uncharacterized protein n=1 Tax=Bauhinia variegata TaxID=167791 RepID=A0ACB9Q1I1_BAUVA|nr:hypothetical protein L6164_003696 [Bauhinia variegata]
MEVFPPNLRNLWNKLELRVLVLASLTWQIFLIIFGSRRKYIRTSVIRFFVWLTYLSADWLATVSLGTLASSQDSDRNQVLKALWAPFLLLHLGGPDTITAYSLEDNSLWLRHFLELIVQVSVAFYVFVRSWSNNAVTFISIPVFISGLIKYSERTWVLRSASLDTFEESLLSASTTLQASNLKHVERGDEVACVHRAYSLFPLLKRLYANLSLRFGEGRRSHSLIVGDAKDDKESSKFAFKLVEIQLGFLYDVLYTKAPIIYSPHGLVYRFISLFSVLSASIAYIIVIDKNAYSETDFYITYALFIGAVFLEIYAFVSLIFSDWTTRWLTKNRSERPNSMCRYIYSAVSYCESRLRRFFFMRKMRWTESIIQHSLVDFCLKSRVTTLFGPDILFKIHFLMELYRKKWTEVDDDLKASIFLQLGKKHERYKQSGFEFNELKKLLDQKWSYVIEKENFYKTIRWSLELEFDHGLLLWHIATDICYECDHKQKDNREASKKLSDYMLYILLMCPTMLPKWIDRSVHVRDTFTEAIGIFHRRQFPVKNREDACKLMLQLHVQCQPLESQRREKSSKSVFLEGCRLGAQLHQLGCPWDKICEVWIEMVTYAASHCEWGTHAQQLRRGGELLTHVCLVMAELGLSDQFAVGRQEGAAETQDVGWGWVKSKMSHGLNDMKI